MFNLLRLILLVIIALAVVIYLRPDLLEQVGITLPQQQTTPQPAAPPVAETEMPPAQIPAPVTQVTAVQTTAEAVQQTQPQETEASAAGGMAEPVSETLPHPIEMPQAPVEAPPADEEIQQPAPVESAAPVAQAVTEQPVAATEFTPDSVASDAVIDDGNETQAVEPMPASEDLKEKAMEQLLKTFGNEPVQPAR
jgi:hypothetical protein